MFVKARACDLATPQPLGLSCDTLMHSAFPRPVCRAGEFPALLLQHFRSAACALLGQREQLQACWDASAEDRAALAAGLTRLMVRACRPLGHSAHRSASVATEAGLLQALSWP